MREIACLNGRVFEYFTSLEVKRMTALSENRLYLWEGTPGTLFYYHNGSLYNALTLTNSYMNPNLPLIEVLNLDPEITVNI